MQGRIILAEFATLMVLHTYTPNNGDASTADSPALKRRLDWDNNIREWLSSEQVLQGTGALVLHHTIGP
jgi:exonuclease III